MQTIGDRHGKLMKHHYIATIVVGIAAVMPSAAPLQGTMIQAGHGILVELPKELQLSKLYREFNLGKGATFTVNVTDLGLQFRSNTDPGNRLPRGSKISATVLDMKRLPNVSNPKKPTFDYQAAIVFDSIIYPDGETQPFLGGMAEQNPAGVPRWVEDNRMKAESKAMSRESIFGVVLPWSADLGPVGIGLASYLVGSYNKTSLRKQEIANAKKAAFTVLEGDLPVKSQFYVVPTITIRGRQ